MFKKLSFPSIKTKNTINNKDNKSSKNNYTSNKNSVLDDDTDIVTVKSNADSQDVTYGSRGSINAINNSKIVSGIITSNGPGLIIKKAYQYEPEKECKPKISSSVLKSMFISSQIQKPNESDFYETNNRNSAISSNLSNKQNKDTSKKFLNKIKPATSDFSENDKLEFNTKNNLEKKNFNQLTNIEMKNRIENEKNLVCKNFCENYIENDFENLNSFSDQSDKNTESENLDDDYDINKRKSSYNFIDKDLVKINSLEKNFKGEIFSSKNIAPTKKKFHSMIPQLHRDSTYCHNKNQLNSIIPSFSQNQFVNSSKANSDKLSTCTDYQRLKKNKDLNDSKQYSQKMNNHVYMTHSPATESYNSNMNNLTTNEKSGCNMTFVFDPSGRLCYFWEMIVSLAFLYNFWVIIYRFAFEEISFETMAIWLTLDSLADFIYLIDIGIHFRTAFLEEGVLQTDTKKLRQHYMNSTMFYIDCLCLLPSDILYLSMGFNSILRCFRLIKIYRFLSFLDRTERHTNYPNLLRSLTLTHYILVIFHWNACVYYIIPKKGFFGQTEWFSGLKDKKCDDVLCEYLHAFYWSTLALTITGDLPKPKTKIEYAFIIVELVFGLILTSVVLGNVSNIVTNVSTARKEFQARLDSIKTFMRMRRVPDYLKIKVIKWFDYLWMTQKSSDEDKCVGFLPAKLKAELAIHVHLDTLKRVEIFQNTEAGFLCALVLRLKPILFSPGDYVCRKGEVGKEMYIVSRGKLQVVADGGKTVLATLRAGSYFGEISILNMGTAGNRRTASVQSVGYSDLFCLSKQDMWDVLKDYPAARIRLEAIASKRLEKYKKQPSNKKNKNNHSKHNFYNENNLEYLNKEKNYKEFKPNYDKLYSDHLVSNSPYDYLKTSKRSNLDFNFNDLYNQCGINNQYETNKPQIFLHHPELNRNYKVILDQNSQLNLLNGYTDINSNQVYYNQFNSNKLMKKGINKNLAQLQKNTQNELKYKIKQMNKLKQLSNYQIENFDNFTQLNQLNSQSCQLVNKNFTSQGSIIDLQNEQCEYEINSEDDVNNENVKNELNFSCQNNSQKFNYEKLETTAKNVFQNDEKNIKEEDKNYQILLNEISFLKQKLKLLEDEKINQKTDSNKKFVEDLSTNQNPNLNPKKINHSSTTSTQSLDLSQFQVEADKINNIKFNEPNQFIVDIDKEEQKFNKDDDEKI